jgi:hypothetical protein
MNRLGISLLALASIFFLFGSLVVAESGSGSSGDGLSDDKKELKATVFAKVSDIKEVKKFKIENIDEAKARAEARAAEKAELKLEVKNFTNLPTWVQGDVKEALSAFGLDEATFKKIQSLSADEREAALKELKIRFEAKNNSADKLEIKLRMIKNKERADEIVEAHRLEGKAKWLARLELAIRSATENGNTELAERLTALLNRLIDKPALTDDDTREIDDSIFEHRIADFKEKAPTVISLAERVSSRLDDFSTRLNNLIESRKADGLNTARLEAGLVKLTNVQSRLDEQVTLTQEDWDAFVATPSRDTLKAVHFDLVKLKVLARHALQDMKVMVRYYKHFADNNGTPSEAYDVYDDSLTDEVELETEVEVEAQTQAEAVVGSLDSSVTPLSVDDNPSSDDVAGETDDSGTDGDGDDDGTDDSSNEAGDDNGGDDE